MITSYKDYTEQLAAVRQVFSKAQIALQRELWEFQKACPHSPEDLRQWDGVFGDKIAQCSRCKKYLDSLSIGP